jgi:hemerythrin-like domain-containing protein
MVKSAAKADKKRAASAEKDNKAKRESSESGATKVSDKAAGIAAATTTAATHAVNQAAEKARYVVGNLDAIDMLINQHRESTAALDKAIATEDPKSREKIFALVADALLMHMRIEEEIFYPMVEREGRSKKPLIDHAEEEHQEAKQVIADLLALDAGDAEFLVKLKKLTEAIKHHIDEEERDILPAAEKEMDDDLRRKIGEAMHLRMGELSQLEKPRELALADTGKGKASSG